MSDMPETISAGRAGWWLSKPKAAKSTTEYLRADTAISKAELRAFLTKEYLDTAPTTKDRMLISGIIFEICPEDYK